MNFKKTISLLLVLVMAFGLVACGKSKTPDTTTSTESTTVPGASAGYTDPYAELRGDYDALSEAMYEDILGEFNKAYEEAKNAESVSKRFALMAVAEAKLLESAVLLPSTSLGGNYAISRLAPNTVTSVMWGNDIDRWHNAIVATEPITAEHRAKLRAMWAELKGTDTWEAEAKKFLQDNGYTLKNTFTQQYLTDPTTWDALATSRATDSQAIVNTYDGLVEYNTENVMKPALAESWEVSEDGLTYTFKIRQGVKWVDSQGREVADLTARDFVTGMQHMLDAAAGLEYLVDGKIANVHEYLAGDITDFSQVGVKAVDDYTLQYTLTEPISYFMTMLSYGVFAPLNEQYFLSQGGKLGADFDSSAPDYNYGKTPDNIAYCGPFTVQNYTSKNTIVFQENPLYWNKDNTNIKTLTWLYNDGKDATKAYNDTKSGVLDGAGLNASSVEAAKKDGLFDKFAYSTPTDASTFPLFFNVNRMAFANVSDQAVESQKTEEQIERSAAAMLNVHFRRALAFAVDRGAYNAQKMGESLKFNALANSYTPGVFVTLDEDVTVTMGGAEKTFKAGTFYGEILQAQLDADNVPIKAWDPAADDGIGSSGGFDGWYNPENAVAEMKLAAEELKAQGIEISKENPIYLDMPTWVSSDTYKNRANALKQSVEAALDGAIIINLVPCDTADDWTNAGYSTNAGSDANYDLYDNSGWSPDFGDPSTYLDTMLGDYAGFMTKCIGLY